MEQKQKFQGTIINSQIRELIRVYSDSIKNLDISNNEFLVWYTLIALEGNYTQQDICSIWSLPKQTVNTIIMRLCIKKYIYLESLLGNRNMKIIRLTKTGNDYGSKLIAPFIEIEKKAFDDIPLEKLAIASEVLEKYLKNIQKELIEKIPHINEKEKKTLFKKNRGIRK